MAGVANRLVPNSGALLACRIVAREMARRNACSVCRGADDWRHQGAAEASSVLTGSARSGSFRPSREAPPRSAPRRPPTPARGPGAARGRQGGPAERGAAQCPLSEITRDGRWFVPVVLVPRTGAACAPLDREREGYSGRPILGRGGMALASERGWGGAPLDRGFAAILETPVKKSRRASRVPGGASGEERSPTATVLHSFSCSAIDSEVPLIKSMVCQVGMLQCIVSEAKGGTTLVFETCGAPFARACPPQSRLKLQTLFP